MADFVMIMKESVANDDSVGDPGSAWQSYIEKLIATGTFRGGSAFGHGRCLSRKQVDNACVTSGFMRFEADSIEEIEKLVFDNPVYRAGGEVELHELVVS